MDPNQALENWREALAIIKAKGGESDDSEWYSDQRTIDKVRAERVRDARVDKREAYDALIGWLRQGGFEPKWASKRERSYFIA